MSDTIDRAFEENANQGRMEEFLEQVAEQIGCYNKALKKQGFEAELANQLTLLYANKRWDSFFEAARGK